MKKYIISIVLVLALIISAVVLVSQNTMSFIYVNKQVSTDGLEYISNPIKYLKSAFRYAQKESKIDNLNFSYSFLNAYGSGFIKDNPIPNDLDFAVGIDLGKYNYDGKNSLEIAKSLVDRINSFLYFFNIYINENQITSYYTPNMPIEELNENAVLYTSHVKSIEENLENSLSGKEYMVHSTSTVQGDNGNEIDIDIPYIMNPYELLIKNFNPIGIYSDKVKYSSSTMQYLREISIVPEFSFEVVYKGKTHTIDLIPEAFTGERLHLARRFFAPNVFVSPVSDKYIKNTNILNNEDSYISHRLLSFRRHLQEILNITYVKDRPIKMFKRLKQISCIMYPMLSDEEFEFVSNVVKKHLENRELQLFNEYANICGNIITILRQNTRFPARIAKDGKFLIMQKHLNEIIAELETRNNVKKETLELLKDFTENDLKFLSEAKTREDFANIDIEKLLNNYYKISNAYNREIYSHTNEDEVKKCIQIFKGIYKKAGFDQLTIYWLDNENIGVVKNSFTESIKDLNQFAKDNNMPKANYKFIKESQIPPACIKYGVWVRNNTSKEEDEFYKKFINTLKDDRKEFNIKRKTVLIKG